MRHAIHHTGGNEYSTASAWLQFHIAISRLPDHSLFCWRASFSGLRSGSPKPGESGCVPHRVQIRRLAAGLRIRATIVANLCCFGRIFHHKIAAMSPNGRRDAAAVCLPPLVFTRLPASRLTQQPSRQMPAPRSEARAAGPGSRSPTTASLPAPKQPCPRPTLRSAGDRQGGYCSAAYSAAACLLSVAAGFAIAGCSYLYSALKKNLYVPCDCARHCGLKPYRKIRPFP